MQLCDESFGGSCSPLACLPCALNKTNSYFLSCNLKSEVKKKNEDGTEKGQEGELDEGS